MEMETTTLHVPHEIVLEILPRLPVKSLIRFSSVCKLWYNSILHDPSVYSAHVLQSQRNPRLIFKLVTEEAITPYLSNNLVLNILSRLPVKSLIRFKSVCKLWSELIVHQDSASYNFYQGPGSLWSELMIDGGFTDHHFYESPRIKPCSILEKFESIMTKFTRFTNHFFYLEKEDASSVDLRKIATRSSYIHDKELVGYCNGLVCFHQRAHQSIEICNPSRREILEISSPSSLKYGFASYGFGFDAITKEYKVVHVHDLLNKCLVFTLGTNTWRQINIPNLRISRLFRMTSQFSIFCNEALFWTIGNQAAMLSFDLHDETLQLINLPVGWDTSKDYQQLEFKGSLCLARLERSRSGSNKDCKVHLHILENKIEQVWIKETIFLSFVPPPTTRILGFSNKVLLHWFDWERFQFYNLHTKDWMAVKRPDGLPQMRYDVACHVENFLSLKTFVREGAPGLGKFYFAEFYPH